MNLTRALNTLSPTNRVDFLNGIIGIIKKIIIRNNTPVSLYVRLFNISLFDKAGKSFQKSPTEQSFLNLALIIILNTN